MNTPFKFDLKLASEPIKWPAKTRDGRKARLLCGDLKSDFTIVLAVAHPHGGEYLDCFDGATIEGRMFLSSDLTDQAVRDAVKRCHEAGMEIYTKHTYQDGPWEQTKNPSWSWGIGPYLPACLVPDAKPEPFNIRHIKGFRPLADGEKWHRDDFMPEELPEGYRPYLYGEPYMTGDEYLFSRTWNVESNGQGKPYYGTAKIRTRRPLPEPQIAKGHNPDKLTVEQVQQNRETLTKPDFVTCSVEEWNARPARLLEEDEINEREISHQEIESWNIRLLAWFPHFKGESLELTYRTRLTREELAALDAPKEPACVNTFTVCGFTHGKAVAL